jgi:hypothetical protein
MLQILSAEHAHDATTTRKTVTPYARAIAAPVLVIAE